jgi:hypothetical protein
MGPTSAKRVNIDPKITPTNRMAIFPLMVSKVEDAM